MKIRLISDPDMRRTQGVPKGTVKHETFWRGSLNLLTLNSIFILEKIPGGFSFRDARGCFKKSRDLGVFFKKRRGAGAEPRCVSS